MLLHRWSCREDLSVSGPAVLSMSIPSGFILDEVHRKELIASGYNVWIQNNEANFFFEKVKTDHHFLMKYSVGSLILPLIKFHIVHMVNVSVISFLFKAHDGLHMCQFYASKKLSCCKVIVLRTY